MGWVVVVGVAVDNYALEVAILGHGTKVSTLSYVLLACNSQHYQSIAGGRSSD